VFFSYNFTIFIISRNIYEYAIASRQSGIIGILRRDAVTQRIDGLQKSEGNQNEYKAAHSTGPD
jgi:hypothetical protein